MNILNKIEIFSENKHFKYLWFSQFLSQVTINIMNFLLIIHLFQTTNSSIATSLLWVAYSLPVLFVGPIASVVVDTVNRRKILMTSNLLQSLTILVYAFIFGYSIFLVYGVAVLYSMLNQFYVPAEAASVPSLVKKQHLSKANSVFFLTQQGALIAGFGLAGIINNIMGYQNAFMLCSFLLLLAFISVFFIPKTKSGVSRGVKNIEEMVFDFMERLKEGYSYIKGNRKVLSPFVLLIAFQSALAIIMVNVPIIAKDIIKVDINSAGIFVIIPAAIGAIISAYMLPTIINIKKRKKTVIESSLFAITLSMFMLIFLVPETFGTLRIILGSICIIVTGASYVGVIIPSQTYLQEQTEGDLRGRVFGNYIFITTLVTVIPIIFSGAITEVFGIKFLVFLIGAFSMMFFIVSRKMGDKILNHE